jgi:hypothetical protein
MTSDELREEIVYLITPTTIITPETINSIMTAIKDYVDYVIGPDLPGGEKGLNAAVNGEKATQRNRAGGY